MVYQKKWKKSQDKNTKMVKKGDKSSNREFRFKQLNPYKVKPEPFPRVLYTRMKFGQVGSLVTNTLTTATSRTFRLNSIWDPDVTGTGSTVTGHTNIKDVYGRYLVTGAKVNIRFYDPSSDAVRVGCRLRIAGNGATSGQTMSQLIEQPMTYQSGLANSGAQVKTFNFFVRPYSLMSLSRLEYNANTSKYSSSISANPADDTCLLDIFAVEGTGVSRSVAYAIKITYYVQLYDRKALQSS